MRSRLLFLLWRPKFYATCAVSFYLGKNYGQISWSIPSELQLTTLSKLYLALPLDSFSRLWGSVMSLNLPKPLRRPVLGVFTRLVGANMDEAERHDLAAYTSLQDVFERRLKSGIRPIDQNCAMISPADGKLFACGRCHDGTFLPVKNIPYTVKGFLGDHPQLGPAKLTGKTRPTSKKNGSTSTTANSNGETALFYAIIYLSPADCHQFSSPVDWTVSARNYFRGYLASVRPSLMKGFRGLLSLNERVVYTGRWKHGFFSQTLVGATMVGGIRINFDQKLVTNSSSTHVNLFEPYTQSLSNIALDRGQEIGNFAFGSTIVLIFEAPTNFEFNPVGSGQVKLGQPLGYLSAR